MMAIKITDDTIVMDGHAGSKVRCGQMSALTVALLDYCKEVLHENPVYELKSGHCRIDKTSLESPGAIVLLDCYEYALRRMAEQLPGYFTIIH